MKNKTAKHQIRWKFFGITFILFFLLLLVFFIGLIMDSYITKDNNFKEKTYNEALILYSSNHESFLGNPKSNVTIIEFFDPQSPFYKKYKKNIYKQIYDNYVKNGKIRYEFKYFPQKIHKNSFEESLAIECAREQFNGIKYKNNLLTSKNNNNEKLKKIAIDSKLNSEQFDKCLDNKKYEEIIYANIEEAKSLGITKTPTLIINNIIIEGVKPYSYYKKIIEEELSE